MQASGHSDVLKLRPYNYAMVHARMAEVYILAIETIMAQSCACSPDWL